MRRKRCTKCNKSRLIKFFTRDKSKSDGLYSSCKDCEHIANKASYQKHRLTRLKKMAQNYDPIKKAEYDKQYRDINKDKMKRASKKWVKNNRKKSNAIKKKYRDKVKSTSAFKRKKSVRELTRHAIKTGKIIKPIICSECKKYIGKKKIEAHHQDYNKPLLIQWLCKRCHGKKHCG